MRYKCQRCGKFETTIRTHYIRHLKRKFPCPNIGQVSVQQLLYDISKNQYNESVQSHSPPTPPSKKKHPVPQSRNKGVFTCKICFKKFKYRQSKSRHENLCQRQHIEKTQNQIPSISKEAVKFALSELIQDTYQVPQIHHLQQTQNITININNYGYENLNYLTNDYMTHLLKIPYGAVPRLVQFIHFHPKHPENHNIKIPNKKQKFALVQKNGMWEYRNKSEMIDTIVDNSFNILDCHYEKNKVALSDTKQKHFLNFQKEYENNPKVQKTIKIETEIEILNGQRKLVAHTTPKTQGKSS